MTTSPVRQKWEEIHSQVDSTAKQSKNSPSATIELSRRYSQLAPEERAEINALLADWVLGDDETKRFDALALIQDHRITAVVPALRQLCETLEDSPDPGAPYEWAKVNRVLGQIAGGP